MSVAQAEEFYGPVLPVLEKKLGPKSGRESWESIIEFMAGRKPSECPREERDVPGTEKSIAIVYQGVDAVRRFATCLVQLIRPKLHRDQFAANLARRS